MDQNNPYESFGQPPPPPLSDQQTPQVELNSDARTYATLAHLLGVFTGFVGPLIIWLLKKDESPFVDDQAKEALNFQITVIIAHLVSGLLWCVLVGIVFTFGILIANAVLCIIATVTANKGIAYRYPLCLRLVK